VASAAANLRFGIAAAAISTSAATLDAVRALLCLSPTYVFDGAVLLLQVAAAVSMGAGLGLEARRQRRAPDAAAPLDRMVTLALLGCTALALAAFLVSLRLGPCSAA
jgi:hypothetical protein